MNHRYRWPARSGSVLHCKGFGGSQVEAPKWFMERWGSHRVVIGNHLDGVRQTSVRPKGTLPGPCHSDNSSCCQVAEEGLAGGVISGHNPEPCGGKPCIRVRDVLELYAAGLSSEQLRSAHPDLEPEDLSATLDDAAREIEHAVLVE